MISRYLSKMVGVSCRDFVSPAGVPMAEIDNPFRFLDGDAVVVYCKQISSTEVEFFDDCATLTQVMATNGVNISRGDMNTILAICSRYNVQHKFGRLSLGSSIDEADIAFSAFLRALLEIDAKVCGKGMESQPAITTKKRLIEYAAPRLLALDAEMKDRRKNTYVGISNQKYTFDFNIFTRYEIDAIPASRSSTAMLLRKISDIFGVPDNDDRFEPTVIVDDMTDELTFKTEAKILSNEMNVIPASKIDRWKPVMRC